MKTSYLRHALAAILLISFGQLASAQTIWDGPEISFSKDAFADWTLPENQDRITDSVWITRASTRGFFNAISEVTQGGASPVGTAWAPGTTADLGSLTFLTWLEVFGTSGPFGGPPSTVGEDFVLHLTAEDIYIDLTITEWGIGNGGGGSFSYTRTTAPTTSGPGGDYNEDGAVDAIDYAVWREGLGGDFDSTDFTTWLNNYGASAAGGVATPEPATALLLLGLTALGARGRRATRFV